MKNGIDISQPVLEILTKKPKKLIRFGSTLMFVIIVVILFLYLLATT
jgi:hypothetical protein